MISAPLPDPIPEAYPRSWEGHVVLSDGGLAFVRPVVPADRDDLAALYAHLSNDARYLRYFSARPRLPHAELERAASVDYRTRMAFVAFVQGRLAAYACYEGREGSDTAEVAFHVEDAHQARGLGTLLLEQLAAYGHAHGLRRFTAAVLPHNRRMIEVFRDAGFPHTAICKGGVLDVSLEIDPTHHSRDAIQRRHADALARARDRLKET